MFINSLQKELFMKKQLFLGLALAAAACAAMAHGASTSVDTSITANSAASTSAFAGGANSMSISGALDVKQGTVTGSASGYGVGAGPVKSVGLEGSGGVQTQGLSAAGNLSIGTASGSAAAAGTVTGSVVIKGDAHTIANGPRASMDGNSEAITQTGAASGTNGLAISSGSASGSVNMAAGATQIKAGNFNQVETYAVGVNTAVTGPQVNVTLGTGVTQINTQAAGNTDVEARIGGNNGNGNGNN